ncbi:hypothetical protein NECAME_17946, partial [Necator americanus]
IFAFTLENALTSVHFVLKPSQHHRYFVLMCDNIVCAHCGKPFASHAAHDSHVRRTHGGSKG